MPSVFKPNPAAREAFRKGLAELASLMSRDDDAGLRKMLGLSARRWIRNVADITPPASGKANTAARKAGENAIVSDLLRIAQPVQGISRKQAREVLANAEQLLEVHAKSRSSQTGHVNPRNRKEKILILQQDFNRAAKELMGRVGWLAAGLNIAATKLGVSLPAWIKRHGSKYGTITVNFTPTRLSIRVVQNVPFTDKVTGYARRWQFAFDREVRTIQKQITVLKDKAVARARRHIK